jgi:hypothetical protein
MKTYLSRDGSTEDSLVPIYVHPNFCPFHEARLDQSNHDFHAKRFDDEAETHDRVLVVQI